MQIFYICFCYQTLTQSLLTGSVSVLQIKNCCSDGWAAEYQKCLKRRLIIEFMREMVTINSNQKTFEHFHAVIHSGRVQLLSSHFYVQLKVETWHTRVFSSSSAHMYDEGHTDNVKIWLVRFISSNKNDVNFRLGRHLRTVDCSPLQIVTDIFLVDFLLNLLKLNKYSLSYIYIIYYGLIIMN